MVGGFGGMIGGPYYGFGFHIGGGAVWKGGAGPYPYIYNTGEKYQYNSKYLFFHVII